MARAARREDRYRKVLRQLKAQGHHHIEWLIGADMLAILPQWHQARDLIREASILILARPGFDLKWDSLPPDFQFLQKNVVPGPLINISATDIRNRVKLGQNIDDLVPPGVASYIREQGLYR